MMIIEVVRMNIASMIDKRRANYKTKTNCTNVIINKPVWALDFVVKEGTRASGMQISRINKCIDACDLIMNHLIIFRVQQLIKQQ